jgi:hypothetical protein
VGLRLLVERGWPEATIARLNYRAGAVAAASFLVVNAALIAWAARAG